MEEAERLVSAAREETENSVKTIAELRDKSKSDTVRMHCAFGLLGYAWGKPPVMETTADSAGKLSDEELEEEFKLIQAGESKLPKAKKKKAE